MSILILLQLMMILGQVVLGAEHKVEIFDGQGNLNCRI